MRQLRQRHRLGAAIAAQTAREATPEAPTMLQSMAVEVGKLSPVAGDIVVVRIPEGMPNDLIHQIGKAVREALPAGVKAVGIPAGMEMASLNEAQMRDLGWVRVTDVPAAEKVDPS